MRTQRSGSPKRCAGRSRRTTLPQSSTQAVAEKPLISSGSASIVRLPTFTPLTKTDSSRRRIALDPETAEMLKRHRVRQVEQRLEAGELWSDEYGLVFTDEIGRPYSPDRYTRTFQSEARRLGLPPIGVHGLRHSLATTALADGVPAKVVAERLGHSSVATTLDRYSHVSEEQDRAAAVSLASKIIGR